MSCLESFHEGIELGMSCWNLGLDSWVIKFGPISKFARKPYLVGGWTTHLRNISQIENLPQIGVNILNTFETTT